MRGVVLALAVSFTLCIGMGFSSAYALPGRTGPSIGIAESSFVQHVRYVCHRWWQWHGARWVRTCWPAGQEPLYLVPWNGYGWAYPWW
jgi:hypothetical protein